MLWLVPAPYTQPIPHFCFCLTKGSLTPQHRILHGMCLCQLCRILPPIYHLPTYSKFPNNSKSVLRAGLWKAEISSASVKSRIKPSCNTADRLHGSGQKGSISNVPLHSSHAPSQLLHTSWHLLPPVWEQLYFYPQLGAVFSVFYDHPQLVNNHSHLSTGPGTLTGRTRLPVLVPYPQPVSLEDQLSRRKQEVSLELKPKDKKRTSATQASPNIFH